MADMDLDYLKGKRSNWGGVMALAIGVAGLLFVMWYYRDLSREISDQEMLVSRLHEPEKGRFMSRLRRCVMRNKLPAKQNGPMRQYLHFLCRGRSCLKH